MIFAEADTVTPWASLILQGGAFGLVVYIVAVLYPKAAKDARDERESRDAHFAQMMGVIQDRFDTRSEKVVSSIKEQTNTLNISLQKQTDSIERALVQVCKARAT